MGRMIDIMRNPDPRPVVLLAPTGESVGPVQSEASGINGQESDVRTNLRTPEPCLLNPNLPALEDDDDVPFIEVGALREPSLRLIPAADTAEDKSQKSDTRTLPSVVRPPVPASDPLTLFTIRFQPVHAARLGGRSPVAELIAFHHPDHPISVQYQSLAAEIARQLPGSQPRVLLFTGAIGGAGTSTVLLNLAVTLARKDARVTVADAHWARPALAARLGLPEGPGLREVLSGAMPPAWCLQETAHPNLHVLPAGTAGEPRTGINVMKLLEVLRDRSDCVLLDAGPWGEGAIAAGLAAGSDAVYLVLNHESAGTPAATTMQQQILDQTGRLRGCVLTQR